MCSGNKPQSTDKQEDILLEIMDGLKSAIRKKDGSVYFQTSVSSESWEVMVEAQRNNVKSPE